MSVPQSRLTSTFDHMLGESMLMQAVKAWKPSSHTERRTFLHETLTHCRGLSNVINGLLEHKAVGIEDGAMIQDVVDPWDMFMISDLLGSLLEVITLVVHQDAPESAEEPEMTTDQLWLFNGNGGGAWVDAEVHESAIPSGD